VDKLLFGKRVLVVEDEMLILMMIEEMLADHGCESIGAAATIKRALNGHKTHIVADALAARGVPFIFSTGYCSRAFSLPLKRCRPVIHQRPLTPRRNRRLLPVRGNAAPPECHPSSKGFPDAQRP
jgi:hypothetical protein